MKKTLKLNLLCAIGLIAMLLLGCKREDRIDQIDNAAPAPAQIAGVKVTSQPGGAFLTYRVPKDANLAYIKAVYEIQPGVLREAKSSIYNDTLALVGYGDTLSHQVKIFSVGKNEKQSEPVIVNIVPLLPPVRTVFNQLDLTAGFGGVKLAFKNPGKANLAIEVLIDSTGSNTWAILNTYYTASPEGTFSVRGLPAIEKKFAVVLRDRWNNRSDTLKKVLKPLYETLIDRTKFSILHLPTDVDEFAFGLTSDKVFDGNIGWDNLGVYASSNTATLPQWFTIDMGQKVLLSRMKAFQVTNLHLYIASGMKKFEMWGSNNPNPDGSYDSSWQLLGTFNSFKPSGLPLGQTNDEDLKYAAVDGEDFDFTGNIPAVRYLRVKPLESYSSTGSIVISELRFWGEVK